MQHFIYIDKTHHNSFFYYSSKFRACDVNTAYNSPLDLAFTSESDSENDLIAAENALEEDLSSNTSTISIIDHSASTSIDQSTIIHQSNVVSTTLSTSSFETTNYSTSQSNESQSFQSSASLPKQSSHKKRTRAPSNTVSKKKAVMTNAKALFTSWPCKCCDDQCWKRFSPQQVLQCRDHTANMSEPERTRWLVNYMKETRYRDENSGQITFHFTMCDLDVCRDFFQFAYAIKAKKYRKCRESCLQGTQIGHGNMGTEKFAPLRLFMIAWITQYVVSFADLMPNTRFQYLPMYFSWKSATDDCNDAWNK